MALPTLTKVVTVMIPGIKMTEKKTLKLSKT